MEPKKIEKQDQKTSFEMEPQISFVQINALIYATDCPREVQLTFLGIDMRQDCLPSEGGLYEVTNSTLNNLLSASSLKIRFDAGLDLTWKSPQIILSL